jgi:nucleoside-diphosphate-sugar epimerase
VAECLTEKALLTERDYLYGSHKREVEQVLKCAYAASDQRTHVVVLRCASISGPYGRFALGRFGIVSTVTGVLPFLPCGRNDFGRQYMHEDDIAEIAVLLLTAPSNDGYEVFNASPEDFLASADLALLLQKRRIIVSPALLRRLFTLCWRLSRGRVPTPGAWKFLTYPIAVDGSALTKSYGFRYRFTSTDALMARAGRHLAIAAAPMVEHQASESPSGGSAQARERVRQVE